MCAAWSGREPAQEVSATTKNPGSQGRPGKVESDSASLLLGSPLHLPACDHWGTQFWTCLLLIH